MSSLSVVSAPKTILLCQNITTGRTVWWISGHIWM